MNIASLIDHSFLKATTFIADIEQLCTEATAYQFRAVVIPPLFIKKVKDFLNNSNVKIATAIGFPLGYSAIEAKLAETVLAIVDGADEIDLVINITALKNADWQYLAKEISTIMQMVKAKSKTIKLILETGLLSDDEIITCCDIYGAAGVDMIKTSTGFSEKGATIESVKLLRKHLAEAVKINASGNIHSYAFAKQLLDAGATYLSPDNSVQIVKEAMLLN